MLRIKTLVMFGLVLAMAGCGGGKNREGAKSPADPGTKKLATGAIVDAQAQNEYESALEQFQSVDKSGKWQENCESVAQSFLSAATRQKKATNQRFPEAIYNAGLAYQRCNKDDEANKLFSEAVEADPGFHRARAQLVLFEYKKSGDLNGTIGKLETIIRDAKFQNVEALVYLAALQMERGSDTSDSDGKDDYERARKNIQRALAIDDGFMPAFNQLAIYYMEEAKRKATKGKRVRRGGLVVQGAKGVDVNQQQMDLAALVASQGIQKNANYAPLHNTAGLIQVQLKNYNGAVKSFARARALDPKFFEAHMNYAAVNLSFRGFANAEKAYKAAIKLRPDTYEAHLGLALAIRGQISDANWDEYVALSQKELDRAREIDPKRPETYYNEAILTQEYKAKGSEEDSVPSLEKAASLYKTFISKAGSDEAFAEAVKRSQERAQDIEDTVQFIKDGIKMRKEQEILDKKAKAAEAAQKKKEAAEKAAADKAAAEKKDEAPKK